MSTLNTTNIKHPSSTSNNIVLDSSGRLLVGTSSSSTGLEGQYGKLQIVGNSSGPGGGSYFTLARDEVATGITADEMIARITFGNTGPAEFAYISCQADGTAGSGDYPGRLVFSTTADGASFPTERMRINNDGRVFVGCTSSPSASVFGTMLSNDLLSEGSKSSVNTTSANVHWVFLNSNGSVGSISTSGSATSFNTSSDYRLKENVIAVTDGITRLQQLKPSRFNFIADPAKTVDGFIAHEVQVVVPEAITGEKDAVDDDGNPIYQGIDQSKLVPLLTAALQEAIERIEQLEARITTLEAN